MAKGVAALLLGTTISVVGETFDLFTRIYGDRPRTLHIFTSDGTKKHAELSRIGIKNRFGDQPPVVKVSTFRRADVESEKDFVEFFCFIRKGLESYVNQAVSKGERSFPLLFTITGGRKTMSIAGYLAASNLGFRVFDVRGRHLRQDMADNTRINDELERKHPEEVYRDLRPLVDNVLFREAYTYYELPRIRLDERFTDGRLIECGT